MGGPKALMRVGGRVWWEMQEERLGAAGVGRVWVVSPDVRGNMLGCGSRMVDGDPDAPMFASVLAGIDAVRSADEFAGVMVLPVDVPAPGRDVIEAIVRATARGPAVPVYGEKRGHPVALPRGWVERVFVAACARSGDLRLDAMLEPELVEVAVQDPGVVVNLNTPEDVAMWERGASQPPIGPDEPR